MSVFCKPGDSKDTPQSRGSGVCLDICAAVRLEASIRVFSALVIFIRPSLRNARRPPAVEWPVGVSVRCKPFHELVVAALVQGREVARRKIQRLLVVDIEIIEDVDGQRCQLLGRQCRVLDLLEVCN